MRYLSDFFRKGPWLPNGSWCLSFLRPLFVYSLGLVLLSSCSHRLIQQREIARRETTRLPPVPTFKHKQELVVIDAGHGGKDTGALSKAYSYEEKALTLQTARIVKNYLEELGYEVVLTRDRDIFIPLSKRAEMANALDAALFVSIHYNYSENCSASGVEVYYYKDENDPFSVRILKSKSLAEEISAKISKHTGASSRGVKKANFAVVRETKMPAILIEAGFLSNPAERAKIKEESYLCYMAWAIARGIDNYLENVKR